jgi:ABC-type Fe3+ transport system substrate-binding protein
MKPARHIVGAAGALLLLVLSARAAFPAETGSGSQEWQKLVPAAEKEGQVNLAGPPGDLFRQILVESFQKNFPKIQIEFLGGSGRDKVARILRERQGGIYGWDLYISGANSALSAFKPVAGFDPFKPLIVLPEIREDSSWIGGFDAGWADSEKKFYYAFGGGLSGDNIHLNSDVIPPGEIRSAPDLLHPKWTGKIVMQDPRVEGKGLSDALVLSLAYGEAFIKRLLTEQKIAFTSDRRQLVEWLVRGRYPIAIGLNEYFLAPFQEKGVGKNVKVFDDPRTAIYWTHGSSAVGYFNRAPHPNAAKVYVNWLLSRTGQLEWVKTQTNSRRTDVPPFDPKTALKTDPNMYHVMAEYSLPQLRRMQNLAKEMIP